MNQQNQLEEGKEGVVARDKESNDNEQYYTTLFKNIGMVVTVSSVAAFGIYHLFIKDTFNIGKWFGVDHKQSQKAVLYKSIYIPSDTQYLDQQYAVKRKEQISGLINYDVYIQALPGTKYSGVVVIRFHAEADYDLFLDYKGSHLNCMKINDQVIEGENNNYSTIWDGSFIALQQKNLQKGENNLMLRFTNEYAKDGNGFHSFKDTDGLQYLYSNAEPCHMGNIFPCFDQPDLKGYFNLTVMTCDEWTVISNEIAEQLSQFSLEVLTSQHEDIHQIQPELAFQEILQEPDQFTMWRFKRTPPLSTYLYAIVVGPYSKVELDEFNRYDNIPMSIYCRESLLEFLENNQSERVFNTTIEVMKFYEEFFGRKFPFSKYDHVFCPEYNMGAMENPGCITINDQYIYKDEIDLEKQTWVCMVVAHELAHMWFGDLVTMKWWSDLWLNESFADFICNFALQKVQLNFQICDMYRMAFTSKGWGYRDDQLSTTHPIATEVRNTEEAENIFDGISYSKGAAVLQQLMCLTGEETFSKALRIYFKKFEWANSTLNDFISTVEAEFRKSNPNFDLRKWQVSWLSTAGLNECLCAFDPTQTGQNETLSIFQSASMEAFPTLRKHKMKIGLFDEFGNATEKSLILEDCPVTKLTYDGTQRFRACLPNYQDETYIKVLLDKYSIKFFEENLSLVKDNLSRTMIYRCFYDMVRDGKMSSHLYVSTVVFNVIKETEPGILSDAFQFANNCISGSTPLSQQKRLAGQLFIAVQELLFTDQVKNNRNLQTTLKGYLVTFARQEEHIQQMIDWYQGKNTRLSQFQPSLYNMWQIVLKVHMCPKIDRAVKQALFNEQIQKDKSDIKVAHGKTCQAYDATMKERFNLWRSYMDRNNQDSNQLIGASMKGFNNPEAPTDAMINYHNLYFANLLEVFRTRKKEFALEYADNLFPISDDLIKYLEMVEKVLAETDPQRDISLVRFLKIKKDDLLRKIKSYECFQRYLQANGQI